jgi:hypothetical protein
MVQSLEHGLPIVNGSSGLRPPFFAALAEVLNQFPSAESLWTLHDLDVRYIVSPKRVETTQTAGDDEVAEGPPPGHEAPALPLAERAHVGGLRIYELRWTKEAEAGLRRPELPAAASAAFATERRRSLNGPARERAFLRHATISRDRASCSSDPYQTSVAAIGSRWPRRQPISLEFHQARDQFVTVADRALLPLRHDQHLREGSRRVDRSSEYDQVGRSVRLNGGVTLPMQRGTRDPLTAFFYARAIPLPAGAVVRIPLNEGGRNLVVDLRVVGIERVRCQGRIVDGVRVEARFSALVQRRRPIEATVWFSADDRVVPLVIEIASEFGSFRAELASYRRD